MKTGDIQIAAFLSALGDPVPSPAGGSAAAICAALGTQTARFVASLTVGKKKYAAHEERLLEIKEELRGISEELLGLSDADIAVFQPLSEAYKLPRGTEEERHRREAVMEDCLKNACSVPLSLMELCVRMLGPTEELLTIGSRLALSDVGVAARLLSAALGSAFLNVLINTKDMKDRALAEALLQKGQALLTEGDRRALALYEAVQRKLAPENQENA